MLIHAHDLKPNWLGTPTLQRTRVFFFALPVPQRSQELNTVVVEKLTEAVADLSVRQAASEEAARRIAASDTAAREQLALLADTVRDTVAKHEHAAREVWSRSYVVVGKVVSTLHSVLCSRHCRAC